VRWIRPKLGSFARSSLKRAFLENSARHPSCESPLTQGRHLIHYALNGQMRSKAHTALTAPLVLHHTRIYKCAMKKFCFNGQMWNEPFLIVIYHSTLVKGAMNAAPVCKLRTGVKNAYISFCFLFDRPKAEQRPERTCQLRRDKVFEA
jgi:hypothetical protein